MSLRSNRKNENCFIGLPGCGYMFESARKCFIACPSDKEFGLELIIIKNLLEKHNYEPYVAVDHAEPGQMAFCRKICSQIIQAHFCIVLLNPPTRRNKEQLPEPNPNVHYEYGMMCALTKTVIPLAKEGTKLAFNIAPLDTIFYEESSLVEKLTPAVEDAVRRAVLDETGVVGGPNLAVFRYMSLRGLRLADIGTAIHKTIFDIGNIVQLWVFTGPYYAYVGNYSSVTDEEICLNLTMLSRNFKGMIEGVSKVIKADLTGTGPEARRLNAQLKDMHIYLIISKEANCERILKYLDSNPDYKSQEFNLVMVTQDKIDSEIGKALSEIKL